VGTIFLLIREILNRINLIGIIVSILFTCIKFDVVEPEGLAPLIQKSDLWHVPEICISTSDPYSPFPWNPLNVIPHTPSQFSKWSFPKRPAKIIYTFLVSPNIVTCLAHIYYGQDFKGVIRTGIHTWVVCKFWIINKRLLQLSHLDNFNFKLYRSYGLNIFLNTELNTDTPSDPLPLC
jgi:hypothetical protein